MLKKMKKLKNICLSLFFLTICGISAGADVHSSSDNALQVLRNKEFRIRKQKDPFGFRILERVQLSGSSQFSKNSLIEIVRKIREQQTDDSSPIAIIDVRQEMHLLGDNDLAEIIAEKDWSEINHKLEFIIKDENALVQTGLMEREETIVKSFDHRYLRVSVADDTVPKEKAIDSFIEFYKMQIKNNPQTWFHVHCEHGHGRTTTFMTLVHILNARGKEKLGDILKEQYDKGDVDLSYPTKEKLNDKDVDLQRKRFAFLEEFYQYVNDTESGFFADKSWSDWKKLVDE